MQNVIIRVQIAEIAAGSAFKDLFFVEIPAKRIAFPDDL